MGQKTNPIGFRLGISKQWRSRWYANRDFPQLLREDELLRKYLKARVGHAAIADIHIERKPGKVVVTIHTGRPGVVIGKKGAEVDKLRDELTQLVGKEVGINVEEIKRPELECPAGGRQCGQSARPAHLVPAGHEAGRTECDAHGGTGHQDQVRRPAGRRRDRAGGGSTTRDGYRCTRCARTSTTRRRRPRRRSAPSASKSGSSRVRSSRIGEARRTPRAPDGARESRKWKVESKNDVNGEASSPASRRDRATGRGDACVAARNDGKNVDRRIGRGDACVARGR